MSNGHISATGDPIHFMFCSRVGFSGTADLNDAIFNSNKFKMAAAAILDNFEWLYLCNGSRSTYIAHRAVIFAIALQLSCSRYCALSLLGSRVWPFKVTWRHRSRDQLISRSLAISYWWFLGNWNHASRSLTVTEIFNVECNAMVGIYAKITHAYCT